ncbi:MAG: hypothetical protein KGL48_16930 [Sphingomonadales bacterium]|nr:hypothetical protein [Sphingomonadales bacterium]MDE2569647.1 hypothetical protein [Sphingomonadales bacterium]
MLPAILFAAGASAEGPVASDPPPADESATRGEPSSNTPADAKDSGPGTTPDDTLLDGRRRPGFQKRLPERIEQFNQGAVAAPPPEAFYDKYDGEGPVGSLSLDVAVPDRWRITSSLCPARDPKSGKKDGAIFTLYPKLEAVCHSTLDPFHHNVLKGDKPIRAKDRPGFLHGDDWFFIVNAVSDTVVEPRTFPIPVGNQTTERPNSMDVFGKGQSLVLSQTFITGVSLVKGLTAFKPPIVEYRLTLATNISYVNVPERRVLDVAPSKASQRTDAFIGVQDAFIDYHMGRFDTSRYDFVSLRFGIQPITADFRGFLFLDNEPGIRIFGTRDDNRWQFNLGAFWRLEKDTNSGLNNVFAAPRHDYVFIANAYRQDFPMTGLTSEVSVTYNMNRERNDVEIDKNGFPVRPALIGDLRGRNYDVVYLGYAMDGRIGRIGVTGQVYGALGHDSNNFLTSRPANIRAWFAAIEASYDHDWMRFRLSGLYASGDSDPYDNTEGGFDAIYENPQFAGADTSYWIRQSIPFAGGGRVISVSGRNGVLNSLRSSKDQGQSNFTNPGTILLGAGGDFDLTPELRVSANVNHLWFDNTRVMQVLRNEGSIPRDIGWDTSISTVWRPRASQNVVFRLSGAMLFAGSGFKDLFAQADRKNRYYSVLANAIFSF